MKKPDDPNMAYVDENGVLHDPTASAVIEAVSRHNTREMLLGFHRERVQHFVRRMAELGQTPDQSLIVVLCVDDRLGAPLAEQLMPGHDWDAYRARGEVPFARGLALRDPLQRLLDKVDPERARELRAIAGIAVLVADNGVFFVCPASEVL